MGSLLFMPGYCEKIDIWHLKRKDTMIQVKKKKKDFYNSQSWE